MQLIRAISLCSIVSAFGCVALAGTAVAETTAWGPPITLSQSAEIAYNPDIAMNESGDADAIWENYGDPNVRNAYKLPHGGWGPEVTIGGGEAEEFTPRVDIDATGNVIAIWGENGRPGPRGIETADGSAGGSWRPPAQLFTTQEGVGDPNVAVNGDGDAVAVWSHGEGIGGSRTVVIESASRTAGGAWLPAAPISPPQLEAGPASVAIDAAGEAVAIWEGSNGVETASRPAAGPWGTPVVLSTSQGAVPHIAVDPAGEAVAVWRGSGGIEAASKPAAGNWSAVAQLSTSGGFAPRIAIDANGNAIAVWGISKGIREVEVKSASRFAGAQWEGAVGLSLRNCEVDPEAQVAMEGDGTAVAIWNCYRGEGSHGVIESASLPLGEEWSSAEEISEHNLFGQLHLATDSDGAVAVWHAYFEEIQVATLAPVHELSVNVAGSGSGRVESSPVGINCGDECQEGFVEGTPIKLTGASASNSEPVVWAQCPGTVNASNQCEVTMSASDEEARATFDQEPLPTPAPPVLLPPKQPSATPFSPTLIYSPNHPHKPNRKGGGRYTFVFSDADPAVSFLCSIDRGRFKVCSSPVVYRSLKPGKHKFRVKAVASNGDQSTALSVKFRVGRSPR
jgi:hypothetical protein